MRVSVSKPGLDWKVSSRERSWFAVTKKVRHFQGLDVKRRGCRSRRLHCRSLKAEDQPPASESEINCDLQLDRLVAASCAEAWAYGGGDLRDYSLCCATVPPDLRWCSCTWELDVRLATCLGQNSHAFIALARKISYDHTVLRALDLFATRSRADL